MATAKTSKNRMAPADDGIRTERVLIDPQWAKELLDRNTANRTISYGQVRQFARLMAAGHFPFIGDSIRVGRDDSIQDGQHRLLAVIKSEMPLDVNLTTGLPPEAQRYMDQGRKRSASDQLHIERTSDPVVKAAIARLLLEWDRDSIITRRYRPATAEMVRFVLNEEDDFTAAARMAHNVNNVWPVPPAVVGAVYYKLSQVDVGRAEVFFDKIISGHDLGPNDPILALTKLMRTQQRVTSRTDPDYRRLKAPTRAEWVYYLTVTWQRWYEGQENARLQIPRGGVRTTHIPKIIDTGMAVGNEEEFAA